MSAAAKSVFHVVRELDAERRRQGMSKAQLAEKCGLPKTSIRRLFTAGIRDMKVSTFMRLTHALGATIEIDKVDSQLDRQQSAHLIERISRRSLAERIATKRSLDPGDIEHVLFNLTLTPTERLTKSLKRARQLRSNRR